MKQQETHTRNRMWTENHVIVIDFHFKREKNAANAHRFRIYQANIQIFSPASPPLDEFRSLSVVKIMLVKYFIEWRETEMRERGTQIRISIFLIVIWCDSVEIIHNHPCQVMKSWWKIDENQIDLILYLSMLLLQ